MKRIPVGRWLWPTLIVLTTGFIWGQSMLSGESSQAQSDAVQGLLAALLGTRFVQSFIGLHLRKAAHFTEYAVLGLWWNGWRLSRKPGRRKGSLFFTAGIVTAGIDECIQLFSVARGPAVTDVLLDCAGYACGMAVMGLLWLAGRWFLSLRRRAAQKRR